MYIKKLLMITGLCLTASVFAGGYEPIPDEPTVDPTTIEFQPMLYLDFHGGYAQSNWNDFVDNGLLGASSTSWYTPSKNGHGGWMGGADLGYTFMQHLGFELGWMYLPRVNGDATVNAGTPGSTMHINSWVAYGAARLNLPVLRNVELFGKAGAAYRWMHSYAPSDALAMAGHGEYWSPVFGVGLQLTNDAWRFGVQYLFISSNNRINYNSGVGAPNAAPAVNMYTAFIGYQSPTN